MIAMPLSRACWSSTAIHRRNPRIRKIEIMNCGTGAGERHLVPAGLKTDRRRRSTDRDDARGAIARASIAVNVGVGQSAQKAPRPVEVSAATRM